MSQKNSDLQILDLALTELKAGFSSFPDTLSEENTHVIQSALLKVANKLHDNYPYFQPEYAGQMLKPPHAIARLAYMLALYINPNNHAIDGSRASSPMEKECVQKISTMFGWDDSLGHLTSGGTMANLEALWIAGLSHPNKIIVASELSHYTHERISKVLGLKFQKVKADNSGRMDIISLEEILSTTRVGTVVVTLGTTGVGSLDPLTEILKLRTKYNFRIHIDSAYGGYFTLAGNLSEYAEVQYRSINQADSIVIDPHKHGLQPYGCGCVIFKDVRVGRFYKHDSPYTYFSSEDLHLGEISLECSRAGAAAVALWATMEVYPLENQGLFAQSLENCHEAALNLFDKIKNHEDFIALYEPELDIVVWGVRAESLSSMSKLANDLFHKTSNNNIHLALIKYPTDLLPDHWAHVEFDQDYVTCLRACLMKSEHLGFIDHIWNGILNAKN